LKKNEIKNYEFPIEKNDDDYNSFDDSVPKSIKNKIMNWLIGLNLIKEGAIKYSDLPRMCANGVFLSDLVNRLEGVIILIENLRYLQILLINHNHLKIKLNFINF
jgi:hypothetical protein